MKQLFYIFRYLIHGRGNNAVKIISLTLGLTVALVLFSKVGFEVSYDKFYPDAERLYRLQSVVKIHGEEAFNIHIINAPVPGALKDNLAEVEEAAVIMAQIEETNILRDKITYKEKMVMAEPSFFNLFGFKVIAGDKEQLALSNQLFLSQSTAKRIFDREDPVGKTLILKNGELPLTVVGVFEDIPENSHLAFDMVLSFKTGLDVWKWPAGWRNNDNYIGYVKLTAGASVQDVEAKIDTLLNKYLDKKAMAEQGRSIELFLKPVTSLHSGDPATHKMILILSLLAFSLLFVSAMNYALISISSLVVRAKSIGVHKCNGASEGNIFAMFIYETAGLILFALFCSALLIFAFREIIETLMQASLAGIFSISNLWITLAVIAFLLLTAGILPAVLFSSIPVTQVFWTYTNNKRYWKQTLLLVQFTGIAFIITLLTIIVRQYDMLMNKEMGYTTENIIFTEGLESASGEQITLLKQTFEQMPQVACVAVSANLPIDKANGYSVLDETGENNLFSSRLIYADKDYLKTFQIPLIAGENFPDEITEETFAVLVNESFVRMMNWTDLPIGKNVNLGGGSMIPVRGVVKDYQLMTYHMQQSAMMQNIPPLIIVPRGPIYTYNGGNKIILRLHHLDAASLAEMTNKLRQVLNDDTSQFSTYKSRMESGYHEARLFRDSILLASFIMLAITLLGLIGYTQDEINRRSKEIAIRKINGATAYEILASIIKDITITSVPAILIGLGISYFVGEQWLQQFAAKITLHIFLFTACGLVILAIIIICIAWRSWETANDNPVKSLKME